MMEAIAIGLCATLAVLVLGQAWLVAGFVRALSRRPPVLLRDDECPEAAIVLCLRGADPFLDDCVAALLDQDYPRYDVRVVVDHPGDPARQVIERAIAGRDASHARVEFLDGPRETCSLKCSSVVQAIAGLDASCEIVALLDADTVPHRAWLRELATALADDDIGAATGNRWYMPTDPSWGALVRYAWNAAAIVQMYWYRIAWGGTLALKTRVIRETGLLDRWRQAFCEDTMLFAVLRRHGLRVAFVPSLLMVNREGCDLDGYRRWVRRQLLTARLYHPGWVAVTGHGILISLAPALAVALSIAGLATGDWDVAAWSAAGLLGYQAAIVLLLVPLEWAARRVVHRRGESTDWLNASVLLKLLLAIPLTQVVYAGILASAMRIRSVDWRGVTYRVAGPWDVRLVEYRPYAASERAEDSLASL